MENIFATHSMHSVKIYGPLKKFMAHSTTKGLHLNCAPSKVILLPNFWPPGNPFPLAVNSDRSFSWKIWLLQEMVKKTGQKITGSSVLMRTTLLENWQNESLSRLAELYRGSIRSCVVGNEKKISVKTEIRCIYRNLNF